MMTDPREAQPKPLAADPEITGVMRSMDQLDSLNANPLEPLPSADEFGLEAPLYKREPLFSRKVMIAWAAATLVLYFWVTFIVPIVIETVKAEIVSRMEPPIIKTAAPPVIAPVPETPAVLPAEPAAPAKPPEPRK